MTPRSRRRFSLTDAIALALVLGAFGACEQISCDKNLKEAKAANKRGVEFMKQGAYESAEREFNQAYNLKPSYADAPHNLGLMFEANGKWKEAADAFTKALAHADKNEGYHYDAGHAAFERDCPESKSGERICTTAPTEAERELQRAVQLNDSLFKAHYYLGLAYRLDDKPHDAAVEFTKAGRANGRFINTFINLADLYLEWDMWDAAAKVTTAALSIKENVAQRKDATKLYFLQGRAFEYLNQRDKALEAYNNAVKADETNVEATFHLGVLYAKLGNKAEAKDWLEKAIKKGGGNANLVSVANSLLYQQIKNP